MKKMISLIGLVSLMALTACGSAKQEMYKNTESVIDGKLTIRPGSFREVGSLGSGYLLSFYIYFISSNPKPIEVNIRSAKIYREKDNAEYSSGLFHINPLRLECDKENSLNFSPSVATSTTVDNYKLVLKYDSKTLVYYLYDNVVTQTSFSTSISKK